MEPRLKVVGVGFYITITLTNDTANAASKLTNDSGRRQLGMSIEPSHRMVFLSWNREVDGLSQDCLALSPLSLTE